MTAFSACLTNPSPIRYRWCLEYDQITSLKRVGALSFPQIGSFWRSEDCSFLKSSRLRTAPHRSRLPQNDPGRCALPREVRTCTEVANELCDARMRSQAAVGADQQPTTTAHVSWAIVLDERSRVMYEFFSSCCEWTSSFSGYYYFSNIIPLEA